MESAGTATGSGVKRVVGSGLRKLGKVGMENPKAAGTVVGTGVAGTGIGVTAGAGKLLKNDEENKCSNMNMMKKKSFDDESGE